MTTTALALPPEADLIRAIGPDQTKAVVAAFSAFVPRVEELVAAAGKIHVTDVGDVAGMEAAEAHRLELKRMRCEIASTHKALKENALRYCQEMDRINRTFKEAIEPVEERMAEFATLAAREQAKAKNYLRLSRTADLRNQNFNVPAGIILEDLEESEWQNLLTRAKSEKAKNDRLSLEQHEARMAARSAAPTPPPSRPSSSASAPPPPSEPAPTITSDAERLRAWGASIARAAEFIPAMNTDAGTKAMTVAIANLKNFLAWLETKAAAVEGGAANG